MPQGMRDAAEHQALVQSLKEEHFAEDLEPPAESCTWPAATLERWFENGGIGVLVEEAPSARNGPLRVLGLHAFRSNANILAQQRALSLQSELLKDLVEISLLDAPYVCTAGDEAKAYPIVKKIFPTTKYGPYREWFNAREVEAFHESEYEGEFATYERLSEAVTHVTAALANASPPFDGIMGFSQGGSLALLMCELQRSGRIQCPPIGFVWIQSSRMPRDPSVKDLFGSPLQIPALVCYHEDDTSVRPEETRKLIGRLASPDVITRPKGGHSLLSLRDGESADQVRRFLESVRDGPASAFGGTR
jgi:hypothetical protein